ncbi:hypothetical protein I307_06286 [Cryptococcus deuterogattii 99/473]|uniref:Phosphatidic acid phosphatase type 2/haloperoxidase domain-containing protein n=1 Tax=Cryptococcus deuterogattii Ram5 TaxID=1296110 RepID=A0A0D0SYT2_9TREE|nr:hypothetical protein I313_05500 [Cryptococcus deuterogattii Ram5]KIY54401.1 hypothetical protein I307_06286 [Cryptococcus deuterogattii 99/473]
MPLFNPFARQADRPTTTSPTKSRRWRIFISYAPDWIITILLWGLFYLLDKINGYRRLFSVTDTSLAHPYANPERIPITVGRPRPDLFARCILPADLTSNPVHGLTSWTVCTTTDEGVLNEGFRSFPSGHSSFAWCGMWYLILYLAAKMGINNRQGFTYKSWLLLAPLSCATLVAISRTMDYRHHATDVIAGAVIGLLGGWYAYRQYYPPISDPLAYKPYSPRIPKSDPPPIPLHSHSRSRPSTDMMLRQDQESQLQYQNGRGSYGPYGVYRPDEWVGIINMNGQSQQSLPQQRQSQTPMAIRNAEIQSQRQQGQEQGYTGQTPQIDNNHLRKGTLADSGSESVEMVGRSS